MQVIFQPMPKVAADTRLNSQTIGSFLDVLSWNQADCLVVDLRDLKFISPTAIVQLSALFRCRGKSGKHTMVLLSPNEVTRYLIRSKFVGANRKWVEFRPAPSEHAVTGARKYVSNSSDLIELRRIQTRSDLEFLLNYVVDSFQKSLGLSLGLSFRTSTAVSELVQNGLHHADGSPIFVALQRYFRGGATSIEIAFSDCGPGIAATLARNPENPICDGDVAAIRFALMERTSEFACDPTRGMGLSHTRRIAGELSGSLQVRSGCGLVRLCGDSPNGIESSLVNTLPGTHVTLEIRSPTRV